MKNKTLKVYGLSDKAMLKLQTLSEQKYGNSNVSNFARDLLLRAAEESADNTDIPKYAKGGAKSRMELKLPPKIAAWLNQMAENQQMSPNMVALSILLEAIDKHPVISERDTDILRTSNYQLVMIGRNLNQIARRLNAGENVSLSSRQIAELKDFIDVHISKVGALLRANQNRLKG